MATKKKKRGVLPLVIVSTLVGIGWGAFQAGLFRGEEVESLQGVQVQRGDLRISEPVKGNLEARNSVRLASELERQATILYLVDEGTMIEAGELVCELDVASMVDQQVDYEGNVNDARADLTKAEENHAIQEIQNVTDIAEANLKLRFARMDLEKYQVEDGEWTDQQAEAQEAIALAEEELAQAERKYNFTKELVEKDFAPASDLEERSLAKQRAEITLERAVRSKALMETYAHVRQLEELQEAVATAEREVEKTRKQANARMADLAASLDSAEKKLAREESKLARLVDQIDKGKIYAPEGGMIVYARQKSRWGQGDPMDEGVTVRERQEIVTIPRPGGMVAEASLHETSLRKVRTGQTCIVRVEALPGQVFEGTVTHVAVLPDSTGWMQDPNQRTYQSEITLPTGTMEMRPGMSCSIEILIDDLSDVLYVPKQCVFLEGRDTVAYVKSGDAIERRRVEVGQDNRNYVVIRTGLEEGETILLTRPASFQPKPGEAGPAGDDSGLPGFEPNRGGAAETGSGMPGNRPGLGAGAENNARRFQGAGQGAGRPGGGSGRPSGASFGGRGGEGQGRPGASGRPGGSGRPTGTGRPGGSGQAARSTGGGKDGK